MAYSTWFCGYVWLAGYGIGGDEQWRDSLMWQGSTRGCVPNFWR